jgi:hypothetical protein
MMQAWRNAADAIRGRRVARVLALLALAAIGACKNAEAPPAQSPEPSGGLPSSAEPSKSSDEESVPSSTSTGADFENLEQAEAALARARQELDTVLGAAPAAGEAAAEKEDADRSAERPRTEAEKKTESPCGTACRAFASLERAAGAVCRLAGEADQRCTRAKATVEESARRVARCGCRPVKSE